MVIIDRVEKILSEGGESKRLVIWGAGNVGINSIYLLLKLKKRIEYIVDNDVNKQGRYIMGLEVKNPADLLYEDLNDIIVFSAVADYKIKDISRQLEKMGFEYNKSYFTVLSADKYAPTDKIDCFLGYSRGENTVKEMLLPEKPDDISSETKKTILTIGGSTTDYSLFGIKSWPYFLKEQLGDAYKVYNGGVIGYTSSQEMLLLIRDALEQVSPDIVISYSGINDSQPVKYAMVNSYLTGTMDMLRDSYIKTNDELPEFYYGKILKSTSENFLKNMRMMHAICNEFGIEFIGILQPMIATGKYKKDPIDVAYLEENGMKNKLSTSLEFYDNVREELIKYPFMYDFTSVFDDGENGFYDWIHCDENGNKIIAKNVYNILTTERKANL